MNFVVLKMSKTAGRSKSSSSHDVGAFPSSALSRNDPDYYAPDRPGVQYRVQVTDDNGDRSTSALVSIVEQQRAL